LTGDADGSRGDPLAAVLIAMVALRLSAAGAGAIGLAVAAAVVALAASRSLPCITHFDLGESPVAVALARERDTRLPGLALSGRAPVTGWFAPILLFASWS
jgi:hypothetical protein